jgi:hypothetical protein
MNTLSEILKQFDEMTPEELPCEENKGYVSLTEKEQWLQENSDKHLYENNVYNEPELDLSKDKVKSLLTQTYTSMVQAEVERLEGQRITNMVNIGLFEDEKGFNKCLEDQINYWKNKLK